MAEAKKKGGKKGRKYGRKFRRPSHARYNNEKRWEVNKKRKAQKVANKFGCIIIIKIDGELISIKPNKKAGEKSPASRKVLFTGTSSLESCRQASPGRSTRLPSA